MLIPAGALLPPAYEPKVMIPVGLALAWLGYALWSGDGEPARANEGSIPMVSGPNLIRWSGLTGIVAAVAVLIAEGVARSMGLMSMEEMAITPLKPAGTLIWP